MNVFTWSNSDCMLRQALKRLSLSIGSLSLTILTASLQLSAWTNRKNLQRHKVYGRVQNALKRFFCHSNHLLWVFFSPEWHLYFGEFYVLTRYLFAWHHILRCMLSISAMCHALMVPKLLLKWLQFSPSFACDSNRLAYLVSKKPIACPS